MCICVFKKKHSFVFQILMKHLCIYIQKDNWKNTIYLVKSLTHKYTNTVNLGFSRIC